MEPFISKLSTMQGAVENAADSDRQVGRPLFSILVRTMGDRNELLKEALCSIFAQTETRYEILVLFHSTNCGDNPDKVKAVVETFPSSFRSKVRILTVTRPGRSAPLNDGIEHANGRYLCILDDDDLLYDHHLSCVAQAIEVHEGPCVFQTYSSRRTIKVLAQDARATYPYTVGRIETAYVSPFNLFEQVIENFVPSCNFFFPVRFTREMGLRFSESLEVLEDWKFLMDLHRFLDIVTVPVVTTAIGYRENNTNIVRNPEFEGLWNATRARVQSEIANDPRLLSTAEMSELASIVKERKETERDIRVTFARSQIGGGAIRGSYFVLRFLYHAIRRSLPHKTKVAMRRAARHLRRP